MFIQKRNDRLIINLFGIKLKFHRAITTEQLLANFLYEIADVRTLQNIRLPKVLGLYESIALLISSGKSLARFGDGEFKLMSGEGINFQKADTNLAERLKEIIQNKEPNLLVGLPDVFGYCKNDYFRRVMINFREFLYNYIDFNGQYCDSMITRQSKFIDESIGKEYYSQIKRLWEGKDIVIVEGEGSRLGIGNDLFSNVKSIRRILCPIKDAYSKYDEILKECLNIDTNALFLLALGPTATVLAYDLAKNGYRALDVGHVDVVYEWFLRKAVKNIPIEGKIVMNSERKASKIPPCKDKNYYKQIIAKVNN